MNRFLLSAALLAGAAVVAGACGDDDDGGVASVDEWCALVEDIDNRFDATDNSSDAFEIKQGEYAEINALLQELDAGIDVVDADARSAVGEQVDFALVFTEVLVDAESEESASEALFGEDGVFAEEPDPAGAEWILDTCGVDIAGES